MNCQRYKIGFLPIRTTNSARFKIRRRCCIVDNKFDLFYISFRLKSIDLDQFLIIRSKKITLMMIKKQKSQLKDRKSQIQSKKLIHINFFDLFGLILNFSIKSGSKLINSIVVTMGIRTKNLDLKCQFKVLIEIRGHFLNFKSWAYSFYTSISFSKVRGRATDIYTLDIPSIKQGKMLSQYKIPTME